MKKNSSQRRPVKWVPQKTSHFVWLVMLMLALLFLIFYFFLRNPAH